MRSLLPATSEILVYQEADITDFEPPMLAELPKIRWVRYWKKLVSVVLPHLRAIAYLY